MLTESICSDIGNKIFFSEGIKTILSKSKDRENSESINSTIVVIRASMS